MNRLRLGLDTLRAVLETPSSIAEIASVHARALDAEIQSLKLRRAVLLAIAQRGTYPAFAWLLKALEAHPGPAERPEAIR